VFSQGTPKSLHKVSISLHWGINHNWCVCYTVQGGNHHVTRFLYTDINIVYPCIYKSVFVVLSLAGKIQPSHRQRNLLPRKVMVTEGEGNLLRITIILLSYPALTASQLIYLQMALVGHMQRI